MIAGQQGRAQFPRLAISDLLVLTFTVAVALAFVAPEIHETWRMPDETFRTSRLRAVSTPILEHLTLGLKLFGLTILLRERWRSRLAQRSPGHWYFLIAGPIAILDLLSRLIPLSGSRPFVDNLIRAALYLGVGLFGCKAMVAANSWRWRVGLGLLSAALLIHSFMAAYRAAEIGGFAGFQYRLPLIAAWGSAVIASVVAIAIATIADLASRSRHDWLHYFAVVAWLLDAAAIWLAFHRIITKSWMAFYSHFVG